MSGERKRTIKLYCPSLSKVVPFVAWDEQKLDLGSIARTFGLEPATLKFNGHFISRGVDLIASSVTWKSLLSFFSSRGLSTGTADSDALIVDGKLSKLGTKHRRISAKDRRIGAKDLWLKLKKKSVQQASQSGDGSVLGARDLRDKLSSTLYSQLVNTNPPKPKPKLVTEGSRPVRKSIIVEAPEPETKRVASSVPKKKNQQKP